MSTNPKNWLVAEPGTFPGLPYSHEAEEAVIGSVLIDADVYDNLAVFLQDSDFYLHRLRFIWQAFAALKSRHEPIDGLTVSEELHWLGKLEEIGGPAYLTALLNQVPTTLHAESYGHRVEQMSTRRKLITAANQIATAAYDLSLEIDDALAETDKSLTAAQSSAHRTTRHIKDGLSDLYDFALERSKNPGRIWGISTGFADWDNLTGGLHPGQLTIISAPPGAGKTTLISQVARNVGLKHGVAIYELEMTEQDLLVKLVSAECKITAHELYSGYIGQKWDALNQAIENLERNEKIFINDTPGITTTQLRANLAHLCRQHDIRLLIVDYVNLLGDHESRDDYENAALKLRRLRNIGKEFGLAVLTIQSMTKDGMVADFPSLNAMQGKSDLQFDADNVFFLKQRQKQKKIVDMIPAKLRFGNGAKPMFSLIWDPILPKFNNLTLSQSEYGQEVNE